MLKLFLIAQFIYLVFAFGEISKQKCKEYSQAVYKLQESPILSRHPGQNLVSECGIVSVPLIIGGVKAQSKEFPHMSLIGFGPWPQSELSYECGGALISETFILTAGHCLNSRDKGPSQKVKLGVLSTENNINTEIQEKLILERIAHPNYHPPKKYNDIGLIRLDHAVQFTPYVRPACLNTLPRILEKQATATGFGKLTYDAFQGSHSLMKVLLSFIPTDQCQGSFSNEIITMPEGVANTMICAGEFQGGKDTCQGDSGGPLQVVLKDPYCMYSLVGITSFGKFCGFANSPAIYTRVSTYVNWIETVVWK